MMDATTVLIEVIRNIVILDSVTYNLKPGGAI